MAQVGPVSLNRGDRSSVAELPVGGPALPARAPAADPLGPVGPVALNRGAGAPDLFAQPGSAATPTRLPFAHDRIGWVRRQVTNISGGFYGPPPGPMSWTLDRQAAGGCSTTPSVPVPVDSRRLSRTYRREFQGPGIRYPADSGLQSKAYRLGLAATAARMRAGRSWGPRARMTGGTGPNNLTVLAPSTSYGMQTLAFAGTSPYPTGGPYG